MPQVARFQMPDGRIGRFEVPDGTTPEQAQAMIEAELPKMTAGQAAPVAPAAAASPVDRIPGIRPVGSAVPVAEDVALAAASAIPKAAAGLVGLPQTIVSLPGMAAGKLGFPTAQSYLNELFSAPNIGDISRRGFEQMGAIYEPKTNVGKMTGSVVEGVASGAPLGKTGALLGGISGAGGEIGERVTGSPWGRLVGGLLAGGGAGVAASLRRPTGSVLASSLEGTTPEQFRAAQKLVTDARRAGITLTGPEALAQVKNAPSDPLLGIQRVVEQSKGGGPTMAATMATRPEQNRAAFQEVLGKVGPQVAEPTGIAPRVQAAATATIDQARRAGNQAAAALYQAAESQRVPAPAWNSITSNPAIADALARVKSNPLLGLQNEQTGSVRWLDAAKKYLDEAANPQVGASALDRTGRAAAGRAAADLRETVDVAVPEYAKARGIVEKNIREVVEPLERAPIGQLAATGSEKTLPTFAAQRAVLFPANPETLTPTAVRQTIGRLRVQDPTAARDLTRQFLETQFDEVTQKLVSGGNTMGGAKFASTITGNTKQAENIRAAVESVGGRPALDGFNRFIQIMEAQGKRQPAGSMTEFNKQISEEIGRGGAVTDAAMKAASPGKWLTASADWYERFKYGGNSKELAEIFTDPRTVERMRRLAMMNPGSERARALAAVIATSNVPQDGKNNQ